MHDSNYSKFVHMDCIQYRVHQVMFFRQQTTLHHELRNIQLVLHHRKHLDGQNDKSHEWYRRWTTHRTVGRNMDWYSRCLLSLLYRQSRLRLLLRAPSQHYPIIDKYGTKWNEMIYVVYFISSYIDSFRICIAVILKTLNGRRNNSQNDYKCPPIHSPTIHNK